MDKISQISDMQMTQSYWHRVSKQYGMAMNAEKTKTMIVEKTPEKQCEVNVKWQRLKGALYRIQILCRRYTFWFYPAGLTIADPAG